MSAGEKTARRERRPWLRKTAALVAAGAFAASGLTVVTAALDAPAAQAEQNVEGVPAGFNTTFYAYVQAGESLDVSFTKNFENSAGAYTFRVIDPAGAEVWSCSVPASAPLGTTCAVPDLTGPAGAWTVTQEQTTTAGGVSFDWNITVSDAGGAAQTGRVWTNNYGAYQTDGVARDLSYTVINDTGYRYAVTLNDYNGVGSRIIANSLGLTTAEGAPRYESGAAAGINPADTSPPYRIFFDEPSAVLPATAPSAQGTLPVAPPLLTSADLAVDDLTFTPSSRDSSAGSFTYSIDERFSGAYNLQIDTNGNGSYDDAVDRTITLGADGTGEYAYDFDGLDGEGDLVADCTAMNARIFFEQLGEIHLLQVDVEGRTGGIEITRLNGSAAAADTIYWNDTNLEATTGPRANTTPVLDGRGGVASTGGVHGWAFDGNSWGNNRTIDDWTYDPVALEAAEIQIGGRCLDVEKTSDATAETRVGDTVTYTVSATNTGDLDYTDAIPATFTDDLTGVLDDATYNGDAAADVDGAISYTAPKLSWTGALAAGDTVTVTYTTTLTATGDGVVRNVVYGDTPDTPTPVCDPPDANGIDPATGIACGEVTFELPRLTITKTASETELPEIGDEVVYTVTATNAGPGDYTADAPAVITDDLTEVLDDATYNNDETATVDGAFAYDAPALSWSGVLAAGESVTLEYSVTYTGAGDQRLVNRACVPAGDVLPGADPCATVTIPGGLLDVSKSVDPQDGSRVAAGQRLTYTLTFASVGTAAAAADWTDDLSAVLDDATLVSAPVASSDAVTVSALTDGAFTVTGLIPAGETVTVTYTVQVRPDGSRGDDTLTNFLFEDVPPSACVAGDPLCTQNTVVPPGGLAVTGGEISVWALTGALTLLAAGGALVLIRRRRRSGDIDAESIV